MKWNKDKRDNLIMQENKQENSPIKKRILQYLNYKNISEYAFYKESGITRGILNQKTGISEDNLSKFLAYAQDISTSWVLLGQGNMIVTKNNIVESENAAAKCSSKNAVAKDEMQQQNVVAKQKNNFSHPKFNMDFSEDETYILREPECQFEYRQASDWQNKEFKAERGEKEHGIPLIPITAIAGPGAVVFEDLLIEQYYFIPELKNAEFMIRMKGNSMYPKYSSGDVLACIKVLDVKYFQWNKVYTIYTESQGVMIKRIHPGSGPDTIKLVSDNPNYPPFEVPREDIRAVALVVGCVRCE